MVSRRMRYATAVVALLLLVGAGAAAQTPAPTQTGPPAAPTPTRTVTPGGPGPTPEPEGTSVGEASQPGGNLPNDVNIRLAPVVQGLIDPVGIANAGDGTGRLFVCERHGRVRIVQNGQLVQQPFLDITDQVLAAFLEQGLYDIEFHPDYATNGRFFVHYSDLMRNGAGMIVEYSVSANNPNLADTESARVVMIIPQPYANHNGGELAFGPDGFLYIGSGDGGWEGDPLEAGQDLSTLLGKVLRIDVDTEPTPSRPYAIPESNPFAQSPEVINLFGVSETTFANIHERARPEIWMWGLRNPWKFSFDPETGDMWLPDVGQNVWEEINYVPAEEGAGWNFGWDLLMGTHCHPVELESCPPIGVLPVAEYRHSLGCAVMDIGVYRGDAIDGLNGVYLAGDYCSGRIWGIARTAQQEWQMEELVNSGMSITSGGPGEDGELYVTTCNCTYEGGLPQDNPPGALWRIEQGTPTTPTPGVTGTATGGATVTPAATVTGTTSVTPTVAATATTTAATS